MSLLQTRLEQLLAQQDEKKQKLKRWEIWLIRIEELEQSCREKLQNLESKGDPEDLQDQIIHVQVSVNVIFVIHKLNEKGTKAERKELRL